ncbi:MAG: glycoside hydrolase family 1 protein [Thermoprotei archaeon]|nr:MAG: glycoside hydrolase family 1 protein [Thermoprotei archaeon]
MFPEKFLWGVSLAGFQFEMGDPEGKYIDPNTDWFVWVHDEKNIKKGVVSGDLPENGINYWELYRKDHDLAKSLGMNAYRLNVEWSRIFPKPTYGIRVEVEEKDGYLVDVKIDESTLVELDELANNEALSHYRDVILDLKSKGFKVILNLVHFTLPIWLHDPILARDTRLRRGPLGYADKRFPVEFAKFSAYIASKMGDIVDMWSTFNEPSVVAEIGYLQGRPEFPPGVRSIKAHHNAMRNLAQAHVLGYKMIKRFDTAKADPDNNEPATVGIIHNIIPFYPYKRGNRNDVKAAEIMNVLHNTWILDAIILGRIDESFYGKQDSIVEVGSYRSKLDWIGINYYTRAVVRGRWLPPLPFLPFPVEPVFVRGYGFACDPRTTSKDGRPTSDFGWEHYPEGLKEALKIVSVYKLPLIITENGIADSRDVLRPKYIVDHLRALEEFLEESSAEVRGYLHWALTDNYEWAQGFKMKFGLFEVDLKTKERKKRKSAAVLAKIIKEGTTKKIQGNF